MTTINGPILMKMNINHPQTTDVNISKAQPPKAKGLGGVRLEKRKIYILVKTNRRPLVGALAYKRGKV